MILMGRRSEPKPLFDDPEFPFSSNFPGSFSTRLAALLLCLEITNALNLSSEEQSLRFLQKISSKIRKLMVADDRFVKLIDEFGELRLNFPSSELEASEDYMALLRELYSKLDDFEAARQIFEKLVETLAVLRLTHELGRD